MRGQAQDSYCTHGDRDEYGLTGKTNQTYIFTIEDYFRNSKSLPPHAEIALKYHPCAEISSFSGLLPVLPIRLIEPEYCVMSAAVGATLLGDVM